MAGMGRLRTRTRASRVVTYFIKFPFSVSSFLCFPTNSDLGNFFGAVISYSVLNALRYKGLQLGRHLVKKHPDIFPWNVSTGKVQKGGSNSHLFPCIAKLAQKYLIIKGTFVPSEHAWCSAGNIITESKSRLLDETTSVLLWEYAALTCHKEAEHCHGFAS